MRKQFEVVVDKCSNSVLWSSDTSRKVRWRKSKGGEAGKSKTSSPQSKRTNRCHNGESTVTRENRSCYSLSTEAKISPKGNGKRGHENYFELQNSQACEEFKWGRENIIPRQLKYFRITRKEILKRAKKRSQNPRWRWVAMFSSRHQKFLHPIATLYWNWEVIVGVQVQERLWRWKTRILDNSKIRNTIHTHAPKKQSSPNSSREDELPVLRSPRAFRRTVIYRKNFN